MRRGYFVSGLGGSQFAQPGALDRLRALRETSADPLAPDAPLPAVVLAATDPASPFGAALPWPEGVKAMRAAGAHVVLVDGGLAAYLPRGEGDVVALLPDDEPARTRVAHGPRRRRWRRGCGARDGSRSAGRQGDGDGARALADAMRAAGFAPYGPGYRYMGRFKDEKGESDGPDGHGHEDVDDLA